MNGHPCPRPALAWIAAALLGYVTQAQAHDTWFSPAAEAAGALALGTGNRFPVTESAVDPKHFVRAGCVLADGTPAALALVRFTETASVLRPESSQAATCFAQLVPFEIELPPDKIAVYFREIRPDAGVLKTRADHAARGVPFHERYTKNARIEIDPAGAARPSAMAMDVVRTAPAGTVTAGDEATFQVLRAGVPLAGFPVELVSERSPVGLWFRTDGDGRVRAKVPLAGRWIVRGTALRSAGERWESEFVTYAFEAK